LGAVERTSRGHRVEIARAPEAARHGSLRRDIAWALALKTVALTILYLACFGPLHRIDASPDRIASAFLQPAPSR
jgi:hypothetical protein